MNLLHKLCNLPVSGRVKTGTSPKTSKRLLKEPILNHKPKPSAFPSNPSVRQVSVLFNDTADEILQQVFKASIRLGGHVSHPLIIPQRISRASSFLPHPHLRIVADDTDRKWWWWSAVCGSGFLWWVLGGLPLPPPPHFIGCEYFYWFWGYSKEWWLFLDFIRVGRF